MIWLRISATEAKSRPKQGLATISTSTSPRKLARQHGALHVAARQRLDRRVRRGRLHPVARDQLLAPSRASGRATATSRGWRSAACRRSGRRCSRRRSSRGTVAFFSGSSGRPKTLKRSKSAALRLERLAVDEDAAVGQRPLAGQHLDQRALAVARNAGDADDLAGLDLEVDRVDRAAGLRCPRRRGRRARALSALSLRLRALRRARGSRCRRSSCGSSRRRSTACASPAPVSLPRRSTVK